MLVSRDSLFSPTTRGSGHQEKTFNEIMKMAQELKFKEIGHSGFFQPASHKHTKWYPGHILSILGQPASKAIE